MVFTTRRGAPSTGVNTSVKCHTTGYNGLLTNQSGATMCHTGWSSQISRVQHDEMLANWQGASKRRFNKPVGWPKLLSINCAKQQVGPASPSLLSRCGSFWSWSMPRKIAPQICPRLRSSGSRPSQSVRAPGACPWPGSNRPTNACDSCRAAPPDKTAVFFEGPWRSPERCGVAGKRQHPIMTFVGGER